MRRLLLSMGVAAALALGACGGDDNSDGGNASTTGANTETTGTSTGKTTDDNAPNKGKSGSKDDKGGSSGNSGSAGGSGSGSGSGGKDDSGNTSPGTGGGADTPTQTGDEPTPTAPSNLQPTPFKTAKKVCGDFLPVPIQKQVKSGKISKETVAKNYSKGYPEGQRGEARRGCLAGLDTL